MASAQMVTSHIHLSCFNSWAKDSTGETSWRTTHNSNAKELESSYTPNESRAETTRWRGRRDRSPGSRAPMPLLLRGRRRPQAERRAVHEPERNASRWKRPVSVPWANSAEDALADSVAGLIAALPKSGKHDQQGRRRSEAASSGTSQAIPPCSGLVSASILLRSQPDSTPPRPLVRSKAIVQPRQPPRSTSSASAIPSLGSSTACPWARASIPEAVLSSGVA